MVCHLASYELFLKQLQEKKLRIGWTRAICTDDVSNRGQDHILVLVFHTPPDDGDKAEELIRPLLNDFWFFDRFESNRFLMSSKCYQEHCVISEDWQKFLKKFPNIGYQTANELEKLIVLIDKKC